MSIFKALAALVFIEGYVVLASELIAIRNLISYVGNGTDIISIIIAGVLLPLAFGYYRGGHLAIHGLIRKRLIRNFTIAMVFLVLALSIISIDAFFFALAQFGIFNRLLSACLYVIILLCPPLYLLGQTLPLLMRLLRVKHSSGAAGKMLFWSTLGSFLGSVLSTLVLMAFWGVHGAALVVILLLLCGLVILKRKISFRTMAVPGLVMLVMLAMNSGLVFSGYGVYYANAYNTVRILNKADGKLLMLNNAPSSYYKKSTDEVAEYITKAEEIFLKPLETVTDPKNILVLGSGGFTFGRNDKKNNFTYVDIDPDLKKVTEDYFLGKKLSANQTFIAKAARAFLIEAIQKNQSYDLVYIDLYNGEFWPPEDLVTQDFYEQVRKVTKPDGLIGANFVASPNYSNDLTLSLDETFRSVFPVVNRIPIQQYNPWEQHEKYFMNILYVAYNKPLSEHGVIYTDQRNRIMWDKPKTPF